MARLLKADSPFGAMLDTLSDFLAFGVAPSILLYTWVLEESGRIGWMAMIFFTCATALRLARFNVEIGKLPEWHKGFFSGVPTPAGAGLALMPMIVWFHYPHFFSEFSAASPLVGMWMMVIAGLMVSRIPTFSIKTLAFPSKLAMPILACAALVMAMLVSAPWSTLAVMGAVYIASIPFSVMRFHALQKLHENDEDVMDIAL
jgi:CDP-diacylglycerol--serine O-phosphatidyltransferase